MLITVIHCAFFSVFAFACQLLLILMWFISSSGKKLLGNLDKLNFCYYGHLSMNKDKNEVNIC